MRQIYELSECELEGYQTLFFADSNLKAIKHAEKIVDKDRYSLWRLFRLVDKRKDSDFKPEYKIIKEWKVNKEIK